MIAATLKDKIGAKRLSIPTEAVGQKWMIDQDIDQAAERTNSICRFFKQAGFDNAPRYEPVLPHRLIRKMVDNKIVTTR